MPAIAWLMSSKVENKMKIGYLFPVAIILAAVVLLTWFILGGHVMPDSGSSMISMPLIVTRTEMAQLVV